MVVGAGGHAEEAVFGVHGPQPSVFAHAYPGDIVAHALHFITLIEVVFGGDEHGKVGLAACRGERRRNILLFAVGVGHAEDQHVLCHPALVFAEV